MRTVLGSTLRVVGGAALAAVSGILTRPCCLGPALLSVTGGSAAGFGRMFAGQHVVFAMLSGALLTASVWFNVRLQAQAWNKWLAGVSTVVAFILVARGVWF